MDRLPVLCCRCRNPAQFPLLSLPGLNRHCVGDGVAQASLSYPSGNSPSPRRPGVGTFDPGTPSRRCGTGMPVPYGVMRVRCTTQRCHCEASKKPWQSLGSSVPRCTALRLPQPLRGFAMTSMVVRRRGRPPGRPGAGTFDPGTPSRCFGTTGCSEAAAITGRPEV